MWVLSITLGAGGFRREANVNYNSSLSWNKAILGWFLLLTMIPGFGRTGFGRDELYPDMGMFLQKLAISTKKRLTHMIHIKNLEMIPFILHSKDPVHSQASITIKWFMHVLCVRVLYPLFILTVKKKMLKWSSPWHIFIYSDIIYIYEIYSHTIWHFLRNLSRILSGIWSGHLSDILCDIHFDILSDILSDILTGILSSNLECDLHSIWCIIWLSIWNFIEFYLALYLTFYLTCYTLYDMYSALLSYILSGILFGHRVQRVSYWVHANYLQARRSIFSSYSFSVFPKGILVDGFNPSEKY